MERNRNPEDGNHSARMQLVPKSTGGRCATLAAVSRPIEGQLQPEQDASQSHRI